MKYAQLGNSGLVVSRLSFGAMTFGQGELVPGLTNHIDQHQADDLIARVIDAGVNLFDTADAYTGGQSEIILGKALSGKRDNILIATKCGFRSGDNLIDTGLSYRHIIGSVEGSLKRLGTDYIDIYQIHIVDPLTPLEETLRALEDVIRRGYVRYIGFCNLPAWKAAKMMGIQERLNYSPFIVAQMYYSLLGRDIEHEVVPLAQNQRLGILAWSPLSSGFLSGKYTRENPAPEDARRNKFQFPPINLEQGYAVVEKLKSIADKYSASVAQVALAWILTKPFISSVIIGANNMKQLEDNLKSVEVNLTAEEVVAIDEMTTPSPIYPGWMQGMGNDPKITDALS
ncbi:MAG: aldo/keto reductase [Dolichospermum sp.]|jgi:aryl-alcohol dehydrogenase-like predicted oxidoreductase|uniref:aldo/keto reductase n=1 Tax=unclassified Microcystis TaxID=2643300 RepID=UPI00258E87F6|nr:MULTISPECIES: aldo/keto reductase [unclassified Microcystis]MCA2666592.1 aldo/keto reductase [Microcystis sp. M045S2]MCA2713164.1 aldo/keto reductase [Microcystis sp. M172S2]MCA2803728.1 aldo/keto reductase [Microcystis sp. M114S2]MCA2834795.1 aldo/keto reductase [Microcystis sp. M007S1]MCA2837006.1 aldo/keto reductase [Microcystis sp. M078S1]